MAGTPYLSEIRIFSFNFAPQGWAFCNGQLLGIAQNQALFALLGTNYGGNGTTNFGLPNLRGRVAMHFGNGHILGESGGQEVHTITMNEMPAHSHPVQGSSNAPNKTSPLNNFFASNTGFMPYGTPINNPVMDTSLVTSIGGNQAHENRSPYSVLNFSIALQGIFPSRN